MTAISLDENEHFFWSTSATKYRYANNDPVNRVDPNGLYFFDPGGEEVESTVKILSDTHEEMKERDFAKSDHFFHCMAMCRAAQNGQNSAAIAEGLGILREIMQLPKDGIAACSADLEANKTGINAGTGTKGNKSACMRACKQLTPNKLLQGERY